MAREDGPCRKTVGCVYYDKHEGDCNTGLSDLKNQDLRSHHVRQRWFVVSPRMPNWMREMEHEGDYEPGDTLIRVRADTHGNLDVLTRRTLHEVEINITKEKLKPSTALIDNVHYSRHNPKGPKT